MSVLCYCVQSTFVPTFVSVCVQVPFPVALRVWDAMLLEGQKVVVAAAVTLLRMNKSKG